MEAANTGPVPSVIIMPPLNSYYKNMTGKDLQTKIWFSYEISRKGYLSLNFRPVKDLCCSFFINYVYSTQKVLNNYIVLKDNRRMRNLIKKNIFFSKSHKILDNIFVV